MDQGKKQQIKNWFWYVFITVMASFHIAEGIYFTVEGYWYFGIVFFLMAVVFIMLFIANIMFDYYRKGSGTDGNKLK